MQAVRNMLFFIMQYGKQLIKKKWATLLLFLFPIVLIGLLLFFVVSIITPNEEHPIQVAIVDEDDTTESELLTLLFIETVSEQGFMNIQQMTKHEAEAQLKNNQISTYFLLPSGFTDDLYEGTAVTIPVSGNASRATDSLIVKELIDSMARLLSTAQANILTIHEFAKNTSLSQVEREEMLIEQFVDFTFFTLGKDKLLLEEEVNNIATSSPVSYYTVAAFFTLLSIWLLGLYIVLGKDEDNGMAIRMKLLGVSIGQQTLARIWIAFIYSLLFTSLLFYLIQHFVLFELYVLDYMRILLFVFLYSITLLSIVALIDIWVRSKKMKLVMQSGFVGIIILISGAIIPILYFPQLLQPVLPYIFAVDTFQWFIDLMVEDRNYAQYWHIGMTSTIGLFLILLSSRVKGRWSE